MSENRNHCNTGCIFTLCHVH